MKPCSFCWSDGVSCTITLPNGSKLYFRNFGGSTGVKLYPLCLSGLEPHIVRLAACWAAAALKERGNSFRPFTPKGTFYKALPLGDARKHSWRNSAGVSQD